MRHTITVFCLIICCAVSSPTTFGFDDWVVVPGQGPCNGHYEYDSFSEPLPHLDNHLPIKSSSSTLTMSPQGVVHFLGTVEFVQGLLRIKAKEATLQHNGSRRRITDFQAYHDVELFYPGVRMAADSLAFDSEHTVITLTDASFRYYPKHARGESARITILRNGITRLEDTTYTSCPPTDTTWKINASSITLYPREGKGIGKHTVLSIHRVPVFYSPYFEFPIDTRRMSGLLFPNFGTREGSGTIIALPYYFNLAPNYDLVMTPRYRTLRGFELQQDFRYLFQQHSGHGSLVWVPHDTVLLNQQLHWQTTAPGLAADDKRVLALRAHHQRAGITLHHIAKWQNNTSLQIDFNRVHDDNHFQDLGDTIKANDPIHLRSALQLSHDFEHVRASLSVQHYQTLNPLYGPLNEALYERRPMVTLQQIKPFHLLSANLAVNAQAAHFIFPTTMIDGTRASDGYRHHIAWNIEKPIDKAYGYIHPGATLDATHYALRLGTLGLQKHDPRAFSRVIPLLHLHAGINLEKHWDLPYPVLQTLEPQLYYLMVPYIGQDHIPLFDTSRSTFVGDQLTQPNRFSGHDRIGDTHQISLLLQSRVFDAPYWFERWNITLGRILYFRDRHVALCDKRFSPDCLALEDPRYKSRVSPLLLDLSFMPHDAWQVRGNVQWSESSLPSAGFGLFFKSPHDGPAFSLMFAHILSPHSLYTEASQPNLLPSTLDQTQTSLYLPIAAQWQVAGRWVHDWRLQQVIEHAVGLSYAGCCAGFEFFFERRLQIIDIGRPRKYQHVFGLQFQLNGLGSLGSAVSEKLASRIYGFKPL